MGLLTCKAVLFDLDGVLIDSTPCVTRVWRAWAIEHDLDPDQVVHIAHGRRSLETIRLLAPELDAEQENREVERREMEDTDGLTVIPGAAQLLAALPENSWTIVTSGTRPLATLRMKVAGLPVPSKMVTADDVNLGKPHPEPYLKGAQILQVEPKDAVVFEDAPSGLAAAKAAGIRTFGIPTTYSADELDEAMVLLDSLSQLRASMVSDGRIRLEW